MMDASYYSPYFLKNKKWYYIDDSDPICRYKLTKKAPRRARISYREYLKSKTSDPYDRIETDENGVEWMDT